MTNLTDLPIRLKSLREFMGYKHISDYTKKLDISYHRYTHYERGSRIPPTEILLKICKHTGFNEKWLKSGEGNPFEPNKLKKGVSKDKDKLKKILQLNSDMLDKSKNKKPINEILLKQIIMDVTHASEEACDQIFTVYDQTLKTDDDPAMQLKVAKSMIKLLSTK